MRRAPSSAGAWALFACRVPGLVLGVVLGVALGLSGAGPVAAAAEPIDAWRSEAARVRKLAENDLPLAYAQAQGLQASLPPDAAPVDRARVLNLLSRIEIYQALTTPAAEHAGQALALATLHKDRVGQAEADLNIALNAINQADVDAMVAATTHSLKALDGVDRPDLLGEALLRAAAMYRRLGKLEESVATALRAMEIARRSNDPLLMAYAHQGLSVSMFSQGDQHKAREQYAGMLEQARAAHSKMLEGFALLGLGTTAGRLGDPATGLVHARAGIALFRAVGAPVGEGQGLFAMAEQLKLLGRHTEALSLLDQAAAIYEKYPNKIGLWYTLNARSTIQLALGDRVAALATVTQAHALARDIGFALYIIESVQRVAAIDALLGDHRRAYELAAEAAEMTATEARKKIDAQVIELSQRYESESHRRLVDEHTRRDEQQSAELRRRTLELRWLWTLLAGSMLALVGVVYFTRRLRQSKHELESQTEILQSILNSMGDGVLVANELGDLLLVNPAGERIAGNARAPYQANCWEPGDSLYLPDQITPCPVTELPLAKAIRGEPCDNVELFAHDPARGGPGRWLSATARALTDKRGAVRGAVVVVSDVTARKQAEREIRALNALRRELEFRREAEREEERRHIARELHDELGQLLSALRMELSLLRMHWGADDAPLRDKARSLQAMVDDVIGVVRNLVSDLRPAVLDMGIALALEWLVAEFGASSGLRCELQVDEQAVQLDAQQTSTVFRMVQESLTNVARHAKAHAVHVTLQRRQDQYLLTVRDDGQGFDPAQVSAKSFGLLGMRERAQMLGGQLDIRSGPGAGTSIVVVFPVAGVAVAS